jgi:MFS family permease
MYPLFGLVGIGWAAINVNSFPMVAEMSNGADVGKYTGIYYAFSMAAQITTPLLSGLLIDTLGLGYSVLFPYAVLFSSLAFITMLFVRHGDSKPIGKEAALQNLGGEA